MDLDDSKYILQLARADVLSLPPTPGDWNVHVKRPEKGKPHFRFSRHGLASPSPRM